MNDYYVYIYWRLDTNEPFYVGMGHGYRWRDLSKRNKHFKNIVNKYLFVVEIVKENLTQFEAFYWEEKIIEILVFEYGFSIDIKNNRSSEKGYHLVNMTWGGEGCIGYKHTEKTKNKMSENHADVSGENNPMYGVNTWEGITEEERERRIEGLRKAHLGKHHTEESKKKMSENSKGKNIGKNMGRSRSIICLTTKRIFYTIREGARYYKCDESGVSEVCRGNTNRKHCGKLPDGTKLVWMYLEDFLNKCEYILL